MGLGLFSKLFDVLCIVDLDSYLACGLAGDSGGRWRAGEPCRGSAWSWQACGSHTSVRSGVARALGCFVGVSAFAGLCIVVGYDAKPLEGASEEVISLNFHPRFLFEIIH